MCSHCCSNTGVDDLRMQVACAALKQDARPASTQIAWGKGALQLLAAGTTSPTCVQAAMLYGGDESH